MKHCSAHGLRKAFAALAAENGATERQLMAIFGWTTMKEASRYTRAARQKVLAASGMKLLSRDAGGPEGVANRDTSSSLTETEMTKKNTMEAGMTKTEKLKLDEGETSMLPPKAFADFQRAIDAPGTRIRGLAQAAAKAQGLLKDAD